MVRLWLEVFSGARAVKSVVRSKVETLKGGVAQVTPVNNVVHDNEAEETKVPLL
jgi:hypothetical protein